MTTITITVKRPTGIIETVDVSSKFCGMSDTLFAKVKEATAKGGKGEALSYSVTTTLTAEEQAKSDALHAREAMQNRIMRS